VTLLYSNTVYEKEAFQMLPEQFSSLHNKIYAHFSRSSKRMKVFQEIQRKKGLPITIIPQPFDTRWMSREKCVKRLNEKWNVLIEYFENLVKNHPSRLER